MMKVPVSWLKEYVDIDKSAEEIADMLTFSGTEVEAITSIGGDYTGLVVAEVVAVHEHPNADKLKFCDVNTGENTIRIVCGAPNVQEGGHYPFAPLGTRTPSGIDIKKAKIRGIESHGMLCAEDELSLSDDHSGLMDLDTSFPAGTPLVEVLGPPDTVLTLEVTPNRPDCLSIIGIARELAALQKTKLKKPHIELLEIDPPAEELTRVDIMDAELCPRYTARILRNAKIGPSPSWMQRRLTLCGVRPINNVVDITNYVLLECGHPLHAFDQSLLEEGRIVVRRPKPGETLITLDEVERKLSENMLVIADAKKPVALAGIMGGESSEIRDATQDILLESAYFKPENIRHTSKMLGLSTESSYRFERGADIEGAEWASRRAAQLIHELAGAQLARGSVDAYPNPHHVKTISCRWDRARQLTGIHASNTDIKDTFESLELKVERVMDDACEVCVPPFRVDLAREVDLIEEFARIFGLDKVPSPSPHSRIIPGVEDDGFQSIVQCRTTLASLGLIEAANYSLVSQRLLDTVTIDMPSQRIFLPHPISQDQSILRPSLIPQMIETLGYNHARQIPSCAFFEIGRVFFQDNSGHNTEEGRVALGLMGAVGRDPLAPGNPVRAEEIFLWLKGIIEQLLASLQIQHGSLRPTDLSCMASGQGMELMLEDKPLGVIGILRADIAEAWRFVEPIAIAELKLELLLKARSKTDIITNPVPYPPIQRDVALTIDENTHHEAIVNAIMAKAPRELESIRLFDIYRGKGIGSGRKSLAYTITYRSCSKTLTDEEANSYHETVKKELRRIPNLELREG